MLKEEFETEIRRIAAKKRITNKASPSLCSKNPRGS